RFADFNPCLGFDRGECGADNHRNRSRLLRWFVVVPIVPYEVRLSPVCQRGSFCILLVVARAKPRKTPSPWTLVANLTREKRGRGQGCGPFRLATKTHMSRRHALAILLRARHRVASTTCERETRASFLFD